MNYKFIGFIAAAAAMSLVSCQKQELKPSTDGTVITVNANVEDPANISKTYVEEADGVYNINWSDSESMAAVGITGTKQADIYKSSSFTLNEDGTGIFELGSDILNPENETVAGVYPFTAAIDEENDDVTKFKVVLPNTQSPVEGSYDPSAYVMIARPESIANIEAAGNVWNAYYYRAAALNRFSITGLEHGGEITSARIIFAEKTNAAGRRYFDLTETKPGEFFRNPTTYENIITLNYSTPLTATENEYDLWFTTWNVEVPTTSSFTVEITAGNYMYTKTFTPIKDGFILAENCLNLVTLDMNGSEIATPKNYSGEYLIISKDKNGTGEWVYMSDIDTGNNYFTIGTTNISATSEFSSLSSNDFYSIPNIDHYVWTVAKVEGGYTILNDSDPDNIIYLKPNDGENQAHTSAVPVTTYIGDGENGTVKIQTINSTQGRRLQYNKTSTRFACYSGTQNDIYLLPWVDSSEPMLSVSQPEQTVAADAESVSFSYVAKNITGEITAVEGTDADNIISAVSVDKASSTVNVTLNPNTEEVEKTATITLSANTEGVEDITLYITQRAKESSDITELLNEDFASITTGNSTNSGGSNSKWGGNENFKNLTNIYQAGGAIRIGASKKNGLIETQEFNVPANSILTIQFDVKGWTNIESGIKVTFGGMSETVTYSSKLANEFETQSVEFTINSAITSSVTFETTSGRAFLDNINIYYK